MKKRVIVGMSGGVDSSVAALLLKQQGYEVIGLFMKNWEEKGDTGRCHAAADYEDVAQVCDLLEIPHSTVNFSKEYWENVFAHFLEGLRLGHTPNPDILCNREIKFKCLLNRAKEMGGDFLATGHYAQIQDHSLLRSLDREKDQTYFLYTLQSTLFPHLLFPIGHLKKKEVRALAQQHKLATSEKKDSVGICFIGKRDFSTFIQRYIPDLPGNFETTSGEVIGQHRGIAHYTLGQRKGLAIGGPGEAWFVVGKNVERNVVLVEQGVDHPALYAEQLEAREVSWVAGKPPIFPLHCTAKIRYRQQDSPCRIEEDGKGSLHVTFSTPQRAITPQQAIVFYQEDICLGGGLISHLS